MPKILIVDDSQFMRSILKSILSQAGYTDIYEAGNGQEGIDVYKEVTPDVVLMDIIMPEVDGMQALRTLAAKDASVVMVTAVGQENMVGKAMDLGAKDFVVKPFNAKKVISTIEKVLGSKQTG